ncbi:histidinol dehydrogenase [Candidatus Poribacteria bacterium]|nr:histidinol dehydrogenase [Candidatus Poribacteria bacterium]
MPVFSYPKDEIKVWRRLTHTPTDDPATTKSVLRIIESVRRGGDKALLSATRRFDGVRLEAGDLRIPPEQLERAWASLSNEVRAALTHASKRITVFHRRQRRKSWEITDRAGFRLGQRWTPLASAGLYVPGGAAAYPSTVLMNAIPARVAGVPRVVAVTPPPRDGVYNGATLGALHLAGVEEVYQIGGAQAVAALAYGTGTIPRVDIVVGPGNRFVAAAKRLLYGTIRIDMVAGPSEVLILADRTAPLEWIAADMLAQAEHDPDAQAVAVLIGRRDGKALAREVARQVARAPRRAILEKSLADHGAIIHVSQASIAIEIANRKSPEHLEVMTKNPRELADQIPNAGSVFIGRFAVEALGDYIAGPNHVLPTGGTARFFSPLSVQDFLKMSQTIECGEAGLNATGPDAVTLARAEGLDAHAQSLLVRMKGRRT